MGPFGLNLRTVRIGNERMGNMGSYWPQIWKVISGQVREPMVKIAGQLELRLGSY